MKLSRLKLLLLTPVVLFVLFYIFAVVMVQQNHLSIASVDKPAEKIQSIAIFGASGTAGDGILKAALADAEISKVYVVTRRITPRMQAAVKSGKIHLIKHQDYLNYQNIIDQLTQVNSVYWAIGINSIGVDEATYGKIHVDFPKEFASAWLAASTQDAISFHYISSSDISEDSTAMWAREKIRAEKTLFSLAQDSKMKVIAYRPDYIRPTELEAHLGQDMLYWFFAPVGAAVEAHQIGQAMIEVSARGAEFTNGNKLSTRKILGYSFAYEQRKSLK